MNILQSVIMRPLPHEVELINQNTKIREVNNSYPIQRSPARCTVTISHLHQWTALSGPGQEGAAMMCWSLPCCMLLFVFSVRPAVQLFLQCKNLQNKRWRKEKCCLSFLCFLTWELQVSKKKWSSWHLPFINSAEQIQALKLQEWKNTKIVTCWHLSWKESVRDKSCLLGLSAQEKGQVPDLLLHE